MLFWLRLSFSVTLRWLTSQKSASVAQHGHFFSIFMFAYIEVPYFYP